MKNILIIGAVLVLLGGGLFYFYSNLHGGATQTPATSGNSTNLPNVPAAGTNTTPSNTFSVTGADGSKVAVKDFTKDPATASTANIPGHYYIASGLNPGANNATYSIFYVDKDQSFTVTLLAEPTGQARQQAEQDLMKKLNISQGDMCRLNYTVLVPYSVNQAYSGTNLGFSFCPGATQLP